MNSGVLLLQTRISALNLDAKRARAKAARETYERQKNSMSGLAADADKARSEADKIQDVVNSKVSPTASPVRNVCLGQSSIRRPYNALEVVQFCLLLVVLFA